MPIYTKTGDKGKTSVIDGRRISKTDARICAIGEIDELNALIGILAADRKLKILERIQEDLVDINAELAKQNRKSKKQKSKKTNGKKTRETTNVKFLEKEIDALERKLPKLNKFIALDHTPAAAYANLARTVCRRAERSAVRLHEQKPFNPDILAYLNRLSDFLFMFAREENEASAKYGFVTKNANFGRKARTREEAVSGDRGVSRDER